VNHVHIVGFGLAGALLSWELRLLGVAVSYHDYAEEHTSSRVAAGMITPITGRRLKPTWRGAELTQLARLTYEAIEHTHDVELWRDWTLRRVFREEIMNTWFHERLQRGEYHPLEVNEIIPGTYENVEYPFGGFSHNGVAIVDIPMLIDVLKKGTVQSVSQPLLTVDCTGYRALQDPRWDWLPIEPSKGEILDVTIPGLQLDHVLTNGTWILPVRGEHFRIGATHNWDDQDPRPTGEARVKLLEDARRLVPHEIYVDEQKAALRPSTRFKRPLVGIHPLEPTRAVFNGLGTKGALQGPWAAQQLARHIVYGELLDPDIDIKRWWKQ